MIGVGLIKLQISTYDRSMALQTIEQFKRYKDPQDIFYDLCICLCVPQATFKGAAKVIHELRARDFFNKGLPHSTVQELVRPARFLRKADYLCDARNIFLDVLDILHDECTTIEEKRDRLVQIVRGLGMKTASHFLRDQGAEDLAIIDTHVLKYLRCEAPKNKKEYLALEKSFRKAAKMHNMSPAVFDAYIWKHYSKTPWEGYFA